MNQLKVATAAFGAARLTIGAGLVSDPARLGRLWIGKDARRPRAQVVIRALGARDVALGGGTVAAALAEDDVLVWLCGGLASDVTDLAATLAERDNVPRRGVRLTVALTGVSVLAGAALAGAWLHGG
jgi:hypothetical protein